MQSSFSKRPSISTFVQEQKKYSAQQLSKIQQSNHKLDQLEQKMKSLLEKDKRRNKSNIVPPKDFALQEPNSDQINRYFESSKKHHEYDFANDIENEDLLLDNHGFEENDRNKKNKINFSMNQRHSANNHLNINQISQEKVTKRQKSTGSLKIFKGPNNKSQGNAKFTIGNQLNQQNSKFNSKNSKTISFGNNREAVNQTDKNSRQISKFSSLNVDKNHKKSELQSMVAVSMANMIHPNSDIYEINQLELMMQKSLQIKQKQLLLVQEELKATEDVKINEYRKNMELEIHYENVKKYRNEISLMSKGSHQIKLPHTDPEMQILCQEVIKEKTQLQRINESLLKEMRQLQDEEYELKLQKKKFTFELGSLEREFQKILKQHAKRMKQNIPQNQQKCLNQQDSAQRLLLKHHPSFKALKTHKKHSSSTIQPRQSTHYKYEQYLQPQSIKTKRLSRPCLSKSKQKDQVIRGSQTSLHRPKISKSMSCSGINKRNRHALSGCQAQYKNCGTDKVLIDMVHELDKLKDIVNKEIVKTRSKKPERRVIQLIR